MCKRNSGNKPRTTRVESTADDSVWPTRTGAHRLAANGVHNALSQSRVEPTTSQNKQMHTQNKINLTENSSNMNLHNLILVLN